MDKKLFVSIAKALGANGITQAITFFSQIVLVPIFIHSWGIKLYGEWIVLFSIPSYFAMADFGLTTVVSNKMAIIGEEDSSLVNKLFSSSVIFIFSLSLIFFLLFIFTLNFIELEALLGFEYIKGKDLVTIAAILLLYVLTGLMNGVFHGAYRANKMYAKWIMFENLRFFSEVIVIGVNLYLQLSPIWVAIGYLSCRFIFIIINIFLVKKYIPWLKFNLALFELKILKEMIKPSIAFLGFPISISLNNQGLIFIISYFLGPIYVVTFSILRTITNSIHQVVQIIHKSFWSELSPILGRQDIVLAKRLHRLSIKYSVWLTLFLCLMFYFNHQWIINLWLGNSALMNTSLLLLLLIGTIIQSIWYSSSIIHYSINKYEKISFIFLISSITSIIISFILIDDIGMNIIGISLIISHLIMTMFVLFDSLSIVQDKLYYLTKDLFVFSEARLLFKNIYYFVNPKSRL